MTAPKTAAAALKETAVAVAAPQQSEAAGGPSLEAVRF